MSGLRSETGAVLTDVMVSMTMMVALLGATLLTFNRFQETSRANQVQNEAADRTRTGIDRIARELRNHAAASPDRPQGIERAEPYDLIAQTIGPEATFAPDNARNTQRVRYCLDASSTEGRLYRQRQIWTSATPPDPPDTSACPGEGWSETEVVAGNVTNRAGARPAFRFNTSTADQIDQVRVELFLDVEPARRPLETRLAGGVFLRNQDRPPVASFTATLSGRDRVLLNGSGSSDPDGDSLFYEWLDGSTRVGRGALLEYRLPAGARTIKLIVRDPSGLKGEATRTVTRP